MPHCLRVATKSRKPGRSSILLRRRGTQKKMRLVCFFIPPDRGARKKRMICLRATDARGEGYERALMPDLAETYSLGASVELDRIDQDLEKLWEQGAGTMTRASLVNLAVYRAEPDSLERNTQLIAKVTEDHACRAIVIGADPTAKENRVEAWVSAT